MCLVRRRSRERRRHRSRPTVSAMRAIGWLWRKASRTSASPPPTRTSLPFADESSISCCLMPLSSTSPIRRPIMREARRVLAPGGFMFLQTAPYLSPSGAHLPKLKIPVPLHLLIGRRAAFAASCWLGEHRPLWLDVDQEGSSFVTYPRLGKKKDDDLLYHVTVRNLRQHILDAGFRTLRENLYVSQLATRYLARALSSRVPDLPLVRDIFVTNMEYVLTA